MNGQVDNGRKEIHLLRAWFVDRPADSLFACKRAHPEAVKWTTKKKKITCKACLSAVFWKPLQLGRFRPKKGNAA